MAEKKWIQQAIKKPGALTAKAQKAGQTVAQYCSNLEGKDETTKRQCNLYFTLRKLASKRK
ncbi:MAG: hypothetical protein ACPL7K_01995 [Armatimonadota bacterium]